MNEKKTLGSLGRFLKLLARTISSIAAPFRYMAYRIGYLVPISQRDSLKQMLVYAGVNKSPEEVISATLMNGLSVAAAIYIVSFIIYLDQFQTIVLMLAGFIGTWIMLYILLSVLQEKRTQNVERLLPDVLSIISQNMISGSTSYNALWAAARPEFGPLALEIQNVARDTLTGMSLAESLISMTNRVKSDKLDRSVKLMIQGMKSGGDLPEVLQGISKDMSAEQNLERIMHAETNANAMFILFSLLFGAPMLFAVSITFVETFSNMFKKLGLEKISEGAIQGSMVSMKGLSITPDFFFQYAVILLGMSAFIGALLVSLIRTGRIVPGVKNIPMLVIATLLIFFTMKKILGMLFGEALGG